VTSAVQIVIAILSDTPAVSALVGDRIHAEVTPAGTATPNAVVRQIASRAEPMLTTKSDVERTRVTVTSLGKTYGQADELAVAARERLDRYAGEVAGHQVAILRDGVNMSDYIERIACFRRVVEYQVVFSGG
jgi:hypothetical protein